MGTFADELLARFRWIDGHADVLGMLANGSFLAKAVGALADPFRGSGATLVAGIEARGFALAAAVARELDAGFLPVRKPGVIHPGPKAFRTTAPDWRGRELVLSVQRHAFGPRERVLLIDDWAETGSQALATRELVEECGAHWLGASLLVDQLQDAVRGRLAPVAAVVLSQQLPPSP